MKSSMYKEILEKLKTFFDRSSEKSAFQQQMDEIQEEYQARLKEMEEEQKQRAQRVHKEREKRMEQIQNEHREKMHQMQEEYRKEKRAKKAIIEEQKETALQKQGEIKKSVIQKQEEIKKSVSDKKKEQLENIQQETGTYIQSLRKSLRMRYLTIVAILFAALAVLLCNIDEVRAFDYLVSDAIYGYLSYQKSVSAIKIIAVDEKTEEVLGDYKDWSRSITAKLIETLNRTADSDEPQVIGFSLDYEENKDDGGDQTLLNTVKSYENLCFSADIETIDKKSKRNDKQFGKDTETKSETASDDDDIKIVLDRELEEGDSLQIPEKYASGPSGKKQSLEHMPEKNKLGNQDIIKITMPFDDLLEFVNIGVLNTTINAEDGYKRSAIASVNIEQTKIDSFAVALYKMYMTSKGEEYSVPKLDDDNSFGFAYTNTSSDCDVYSFYDVYSGKIHPSEFAGSIVLIGDYTQKESMVNAPNQRETQMHELELQVNILTALLDQKTIRYVSWFYLSFFYAAYAALLFLILTHAKKRTTAILCPCIVFGMGALNTFLNQFGYYLPFFVPVILTILIIITNLLMRFIIMRRSRLQMETVLKKYVDAQIVNEIVQNGYIEAKLGIMRKDIAVLFVDIRGFTSLSEVLAPEQVVEILNSYLTIVYEAVEKNGGTLDKFIGDAAMAVFNSPSDMDDYVYKAVKTACDIRSFSDELNQTCLNAFDTEVSFGIGVNCGEAVIGNIGCDTRMDYTAIGDTVNTSSRLEGAAKKGEILISEEVYNRLRGRIQAEYAGEYTLKGKQNDIAAYRVIGIIENSSETVQEKRINTTEMEVHI